MSTLEWTREVYKKTNVTLLFMDVSDKIMLFMIPLMILIYRLMVRTVVIRAIKKYVIPELISKELILTKYKVIGALGFGDFYSNYRIFISKFFKYLSFISYYAYVYYKDNNSENRVTILRRFTAANITQKSVSGVK